MGEIAPKIFEENHNLCFREKLKSVVVVVVVVVADTTHLCQDGLQI